MSEPDDKTQPSLKSSGVSEQQQSAQQSARVLEAITLKLDKLDAKVDAHRAEGNKRGDEQSAHITRVNSRLDDVERRLALVESEELGAAISSELHSDEVRKELVSLREHVDARFEAKERINRAICHALGVNYEQLTKAPLDLTSTQALKLSIPPRATLGNLSKQQRASLVGSALTIVILLLQLILHLSRG